MWPYLHIERRHRVHFQHNLQSALRICKATLTHARGSGAPVFSNDSIIRPKCCLLANLSARLPNEGRALSICLVLSLCPSVSPSRLVSLYHRLRLSPCFFCTMKEKTSVTVRAVCPSARSQPRVCTLFKMETAV